MTNIVISLTRGDREKILCGKKRAVITPKKVGGEGDHFFVGTKCFILTIVVAVSLRMACYKFYQVQGFLTVKDAIRWWEIRHPKMLVDDDPERCVYLHRFVELKQE